MNDAEIGVINSLESRNCAPKRNRSKRPGAKERAKKPVCSENNM